MLCIADPFAALEGLSNPAASAPSAARPALNLDDLYGTSSPSPSPSLGPALGSVPGVANQFGGLDLNFGAPAGMMQGAGAVPDMWCRMWGLTGIVVFEDYLL